MKKLIAMIAAILLAGGAATPVDNLNRGAAGLYARAGVVETVDGGADVVTVIDGAGHVWEFYGAEDWEPGDGCAMVIHDNGTPDELHDDMILTAQFFRVDMLGA